jgi:hypothetical protein
LRALSALSVLFMGLLCSPAQAAVTPRQEPAPPSASTSSSAPAKKTRQLKSKHADDFLVKGTVFTPDGLAFPGVELRIRRANEKKFRWQTYTDSRGEFAVRVKQGTQYQVVVHAKGFEDQMKPIDATSGNEIDDMVFRMEPAERGKK